MQVFCPGELWTTWMPVCSLQGWISQRIYILSVNEHFLIKFLLPLGLGFYENPLLLLSHFCLCVGFLSQENLDHVDDCA